MMKVFFVVFCWFVLAFLFHNDNHEKEAETCYMMMSLHHITSDKAIR